MNTHEVKPIAMQDATHRARPAPDKLVQVSVKLLPTSFAWLFAYAQRRGIKLADVIRLAVTDFIDKHSASEAEKQSRRAA